jgi:hypothetical protein
MSVDPTQVNAGDDEAALDAELAQSIESVQAGKTVGVGNPDGSVAPVGQTAASAPTGATGPEAPTGATGPTGTTGPTGGANGNPQPTGASGEMEFRIPNQGKFESDEAYARRVELFDLVRRRKAATTPEAKEALSAEIRKAKGELKTLGVAGRFTQQKAEGTTTTVPGPTGATGGVDPALLADQERLRALGGATKEDVEAIIQQTQHDATVAADLKAFVEKHAALKDEDVREVFFDFVDSSYVWQGKAGKELATVLEMAYENMFRPAESVQERVLKGASVQEKVNAMQFPGGTGGKTTYSPEMQKSIDELKATGLSEEKAIELLSE